jgi:hypothetical protein
VKVLPDKVVVDGFLFDVVEASLDNEEDAGDSDTHQRRIAVNDDCPPSTRVETFYHEVVHMMLALAGYTYLLDGKTEEALAQTLGASLARFVTDNDNLPKLKEER